jgi:hypothetical protein
LVNATRTGDSMSITNSLTGRAAWAAAIAFAAVCTAQEPYSKPSR